MSLTLSSPAIITQAGQSNIGNNAGMGSKRGRLLIRQQRVKKDGDQAGDLETPEAGAYSDYMLSVPSSGSCAKMERHASEPSPASSSLISSPSVSSQNLLSVPSHSSYLVKQHSHPLLPSQSSAPGTSYTLTRQLSYPTQTSSHMQTIVSSVSTHAAQEIVASGQLLQLQHHKPPVRSQTLPHYTITEMEMGGNDKQIGGSPTVVIIPDMMGDQMQQIQQIQQPPHQKQSQHHLQLPSIRVKSEELQRSISSPLVSLLEISWFAEISHKFSWWIRRRREAISRSKQQHVPAIVQHFDLVPHSAATSAGIRSMRMVESCGGRPNITVLNVKQICASCHVSKNITSVSRQRVMIRRCRRIKPAD